MLISQFGPSKPVPMHSQSYLLIPSTQLPPFEQGEDSQSSMLISQKSPKIPSRQLQLKEAMPSMQVPPFEQGEEAQSLIFVSQSLPENGLEGTIYSYFLNILVSIPVKPGKHVQL